MTKIDFKGQIPDQMGAPGHYYYGWIIGFSNDSLNGRYRVSMIGMGNFVARTQMIAEESCLPVNKIEELLYF